MAGNGVFSSRVVAVTGGASGIGAALCRAFGTAGARIAVIDMDVGAIDALIIELTSGGVDAIGLRCDVADRDQCESSIGAVIGRFGGIDILVNNAGITQRGAFAATDVAVIRRVMEVNFFGSLYCAKAALGSLIERKGMIIVTSSHAGYGPLLGRTGYSASKHALHGLFESLRSEVRPLGVHVMMVCPGFTKTSLQTRALGPDGSVTTHPQSTVGAQDDPEHVARAVVRGARLRKSIIILTPVGKMTYLLCRLAPTLYERVMAKKLRSEITE